MKIAAALLACTLVLTGCGGSDDEPDPKPTPSADSRRDGTDPKASLGHVVKIIVKDGKVTPRGGRVEVKAGTPVTLDITSDAAEEIHVHSDPEHEYELGAGDSIRETFTIDTPGQVAVEAHHLDATIVQLVVKP